jgi:E3 ubiquitin-protein ligase TRIP12
VHSEAERELRRGGGAALGALWERVHTLTYRLRTADDADAAAPAAEADLPAPSGASPIDVLLASIALPASLSSPEGGDCTCGDVLSLLRLLHGAAGGVAPATAFLCAKLSGKLSRQLGDSLSLCANALPAWATTLPRFAPFLFPFDTRRSLFYATALGLPRALQRMQAQAGPAPGGRAAQLARLPRQKVRISREAVLESAAKVFSLPGFASQILEVEFFGEEGSGTGPTLEFYTLLSQSFASRRLRMWRADEPPAPAAAADASECPLQLAAPVADAEAVVARHGLFPRPLPAGAGAREVERVCGHFNLLGRVCAKALQDGRMVDLPLSHAFYSLALLSPPPGALRAADVAAVDPQLASSLAELEALGQQAEALAAEGAAAAERLQALSLRGCAVKDLCLSFTLPGDGEHELLPGGASIEVGPAQLARYVALVLDATLGAGVARQLAAFRAGFDSVFQHASLRLFDAAEVEALLCGAAERWTPEALAEACRFDHGYTAASPPVLALLSVLSDFSGEQQQAFLRFVTGAPRLPPGGLARLTPRLTIVCKHPAIGAAQAGGSPPALRAGMAQGTPAADGDLPCVTLVFGCASE